MKDSLCKCARKEREREGEREREREKERERERERFIMCAHRNKHIHARMSVKDANEREVNGDS